MRGRVAGILSFAFVLLVSAVDLSGGATVNNHATVSALDLATGNQEWSARLPKPEVTDAPVAGPRGVYVKSQAAGREVCNFGGHSTLTAFAASSGHVQWRVKDQQPGAADDAIVLGQHLSPRRMSQFNGLDTASGKRRWSVTRIGGSPPSVVDGVTIGSDGRSLQALDAHTGRRRWTAPLPPANGGSGTRIHGSLYMLGINGPVVAGTTPDSFLTAIDATRGTQRWQVRVAGDTGPVAAVPSAVVVAVGSGLSGPPTSTLIGFDAISGRELWRQAAPTQIPAGGMVADATTVYAITTGFQLLAIDPQSGAIRWSTTLSTGGQSVWLIGTGDGVVVVTWYQNLAAIDARSGQVRWHHAAGASNEAIPAAISNGRVFVVTVARPCQDSD